MLTDDGIETASNEIAMTIGNIGHSSQWLLRFAILIQQATQLTMQKASKDVRGHGTFVSNKDVRQRTDHATVRIHTLNRMHRQSAVSPDRCPPPSARSPPAASSTCTTARSPARWRGSTRSTSILKRLNHETRPLVPHRPAARAPGCPHCPNASQR